MVRSDIRLRRFTRSELEDLLEWLDAQSAETETLIWRARNVERRANLEALLIELHGVRQRVFDELYDRLESFTGEVVRDQNAFVATLGASLLALRLGQLGEAIVADIVRRRPINGRLFKEWTDGLRTDEAARLARALRLAVASGIGGEDLVSEARQALRVTARNVEGLAQSLATHASALAREETLSDASGLVAWRWVSILDGRTSDICRARSGKVYPVDEPHPTPPAHVRCRSSIVPVFAGQGPVLEENYGQWLARQDAEAQDEILGPSRAALFRSGRFKLDDFVEEPSGRRRRLDELLAEAR